MQHKLVWLAIVGTTLATLVNSEAILAPAVPELEAAATGSSFSKYWHQGQAEITSYDLEQSRYGEIHPGHAVLIFVTEDFSKSKQVKLDYGTRAGEDRAPVLKLNLTKKFNTGVYPYSMMSSVFTPIDVKNSPRTLKATTSTQEWCGHTFQQLNRTSDGYRVELRSYFESEGDLELELGDVPLEDGIWNLIRIDPSALPVGEIQMIPAAMYQRLRHTDLQAHAVVAKLENDRSDSSFMTYSLEYPKLGRSLIIRFKAELPHEIESWEESSASGVGSGARALKTRAVANKRKMLDYWNRNSVSDSSLREDLGL